MLVEEVSPVNVAYQLATHLTNLQRPKNMTTEKTGFAPSWCEAGSARQNQPHPVASDSPGAGRLVNDVRVSPACNQIRPTLVTGHQTGRPVRSAAAFVVRKDHRMLLPLRDSNISQGVCADTRETITPSLCRTDCSIRLYARVQS
jgi:hypothetical protein